MGGGLGESGGPSGREEAASETEEEEERGVEGWPEVEGTRDHLFEVERFKHKSRGKHHGPPSRHLRGWWGPFKIYIRKKPKLP